MRMNPSLRTHHRLTIMTFSVLLSLSACTHAPLDDTASSMRVTADEAQALNAPTHTPQPNVEATATQPTPTKAAIASAHPLATEAGMAILAQGGNAFDAAIAVAATLGVVEPYSAGIGGGGFWLIYDAEQQRYRFIDARERAPAAAHADYYLDADGNVERDRAINGPSAAAIPGQAAAFVHLQQQYGRLPLRDSLANAIQHAQHGFLIDERYRQFLGYRLVAMQRFPTSAALFLDNNDMPELGFRVVQTDLANTLQRLAEQGFDGFYRGDTAQRMVSEVQRHGGDWQLSDLADYRIVEREPIHLHYGELEFISAPPPSSGGIAIAQMLTMLSHYDWQSLDQVAQTHLLVEVMRRAYRDRAYYLGDPDFVDVPTHKLLSEQRAQHWVSSIRPDQATPSDALGSADDPQQGLHTTHFSVLDRDGNMVSATLSINLPFGSAFTVAGTGIVLNNEMDDFSAKPGAGNAYGLVGNHANAIAPGKRPLSSMTPTIINSPHQTAILGTPGGSRIITMVLLGVLEHLQQRPVDDWVARPRFHHQYRPDVIQHEDHAFSDEEIEQLQAMGHELRLIQRRYGNMQAILWDKRAHEVTTASDPRGVGRADLSD